MDYEVIWSGTLDRQGRAPHATGYIGRSSLFICDTRAPKETAPLRLNKDALCQAAKRRYEAKTRTAAAHARAALEASRTKGRAKRAAKNLYHAAYYQQRKAAQQDLFEGA